MAQARKAGIVAGALLMLLLAACSPNGSGSSGNPTLSSPDTNTTESETLSETVNVTDTSGATQ